MKDVNNRNSFDLLRLLAASLVLLSHSFPLAGMDANEPFQRFTTYGSLGTIAVDIFFILSGYLVTTSFLNDSNAVHFLVKRILRIVPALWCVILLTVFVVGPILTTASPDGYFRSPLIYDYLGNLFFKIRYFLPGMFSTNHYPNAVNGSLWTLPIEVVMYVFVLLLGMLRLLSVRGCISMILFFTTLYILRDTSYGFVFNGLPDVELKRLGILYFTGALFVFIPLKWLCKKEAVIACLVLLLLASQSSYALFVTCLTLPYLIISWAVTPSKVADLIRQNGDFSYGVYVYGFLVQQIVVMQFKNQVTPLGLFLISFSLTLCLAFCSWHLIESPALRLKKFLVDKLKQS